MGWPHRNGFQSLEGNAARVAVLGFRFDVVKEVRGMALRICGDLIGLRDEKYDRPSNDDIRRLGQRLDALS